MSRLEHATNICCVVFVTIFKLIMFLLTFIVMLEALEWIVEQYPVNFSTKNMTVVEHL